MGLRHQYFIARTVLVRNGNIEEATRLLNRILGKEGIFDQYRRTRYYEKPHQVADRKKILNCMVTSIPQTQSAHNFLVNTRRRVNFEKCKAIYNEDMDRKIQFVLRKNRTDPFPGCS